MKKQDFLDTLNSIQLYIYDNAYNEKIMQKIDATINELSEQGEITQPDPKKLTAIKAKNKELKGSNNELIKLSSYWEEQATKEKEKYKKVSDDYCNLYEKFTNQEQLIKYMVEPMETIIKLRNQ